MPHGTRPLAVIVRADEPVRGSATASARSLTERLASRGENVVPRAAAAPDPAARLAALEEAFYALQMERTAIDARAFVTSMEQGSEGLVDTARLVRALLLLAEASAGLGDGPASEEAIDRALCVDPNLTLDPARYSPVMRARVEGRRAALGDERGTIEPTDLPNGARVFVDGSPLDATVRRGRHIVQIEALGFALQTSVLDVLGPTSLAFAAERTPDALDAIAGAPGEDIPRALRDALDAQGWDARLLDVRLVDGSARYRWEHEDVVERVLPLDTPPDRIAASLDQEAHDRARDAARARRRRRIAGWASGAAVLSAAALTTGILFAPTSPRGWSGQGTIEGGE